MSGRFLLATILAITTQKNKNVKLEDMQT